mmetsp:Transcript_32019/g.38766  ORF Transcript_32019/g.38766 Transcript_32019/m.38766 type:complete len:376 (-) Transcript_32019:516-1643(-)
MGGGSDGTNRFQTASEAPDNTPVQFRQWTSAEVEKRAAAGEPLVSLDGEVYDLTEFLDSHPGGREILEDYFGQDISKVFRGEDDGIHAHSKLAFKQLAPLRIGYLDGHTKRADNSSSGGYEVNFSKGVVFQVGYLLDEYDDWCHQPDGSCEPLRFFDNPILEAGSRTVWYAVPCIWVPLALASFYKGWTEHDPSAFIIATRLVLGFLCWELLEYTLHRFLFHAVPSTYWSITAHFLLHGCHHKRPMDHLRLVFPPAAALPIVVLVYFGLFSLMPAVEAYFVFGACLLGYVGYDCTHYYLHHGKNRGGYLGTLKTKHLAHHYKDWNVSFGITSHIFDYVFQTMPAYIGKGYMGEAMAKEDLKAKQDYAKVLNSKKN